MTGLHRIDTRDVEITRQFQAFEQFAMSSGFGVTGVTRPRDASIGHLSTATALAGQRNAICFANVEDPNTVFMRPSSSFSTIITLSLSSAPVETVADGKRVSHAPGSMTLTSASRHYERTVFQRGWEVGINVHRTDLQLSETDLDRAVNGGVTWSDWHREVLISTVKAATALTQRPLPPPDPTGVDRYIVGITELLLASALNLQDLQLPTPQSRRRRAETYIRENLFKSDLSPETIAADQHISVRHLFRIFADGPSVNATITRARLDHADRMLRDPSHARETIAEIATQCGFVSAAHFSRAFKARTGMTPTEARRSAVSPAPTVPAPNPTVLGPSDSIRLGPDDRAPECTSDSPELHRVQ